MIDALGALADESVAASVNVLISPTLFDLTDVRFDRETFVQFGVRFLLCLGAAVRGRQVAVASRC